MKYLPTLALVTCDAELSYRQNKTMYALRKASGLYSNRLGTMLDCPENDRLLDINTNRIKLLQGSVVRVQKICLLFY
jgi:hypothetical protein